MKLGSIILNWVLILLIAGYLAYREWWKVSVVYSSISPDGRWSCEVTDIDPNPNQVTLVWSVRATGSQFPLTGTQYVTYHDSVLPAEVKFQWSQNQLVVTASGKSLTCDIAQWQQHWRE